MKIEISLEHRWIDASVTPKTAYNPPILRLEWGGNLIEIEASGEQLDQIADVINEFLQEPKTIEPYNGQTMDEKMRERGLKQSDFI